MKELRDHLPFALPLAFLASACMWCVIIWTFVGGTT